MTRREAYIALNMMEAMGPVRLRNIVTALGAPEAIWDATEEDLRRAEGIGTETARSIIRQCKEVDAAAEEARARRCGARIITFEDPEYPESLKQIYDPPITLYVKGTLEKVDKSAIAVVGTRNVSHYGASVADRLSYQLSKVGFTVVSGLARGVDTVAHKAALKAEGRTIAVLGSAIDCLYPEENAQLADRIAENGAVISEYTMGRQPDRTTFPYRNRVVSGLSMGLVVVEAGVKSGAVITATEALEQGRSVFAVPGRIDLPAARGCHMLIKQGAKLCEGVDDVLQEFEFLFPEAKKKADAAMPRRPDVPLTNDEQVVVKALWKGGLDVDSLARAANLSSSQLSALLLGLEMKRVIRILPGRVVELREDLMPG
ncbi:MAG: DNA-processing protein DprA [Kiritimatiellae bacterium]|nr:DNA-processing protein DprA [Kiritimatiellia bacterium]